MNIYEKLTAIQVKLKAPKGQESKFGGYKYRSCEDILESLKPILEEFKATMFITDTVELIGTRFYIKATATLINMETPEEKIQSTAYAREEESKKGMDSSQLTGATSSYARKYALNALFAIDDTKDADDDKGEKHYCEKCNVEIPVEVARESYKYFNRHKYCTRCQGQIKAQMNKGNNK